MIVKCPKCGADIEHLINYCEKRMTYEVSLDVNGYADYNELDDFMPCDGNYVCPECDEVVTTSHTDAERILKGQTPD